MIDSFYMNGDFWMVRFVNPTNRILVDRTGTLTIGVSDYGTITLIHLSDKVCDPNRVLKEIKEVAGNRVEVNVAVPGLCVELKRLPF